jgi:hypothetical protein
MKVYGGSACASALACSLGDVVTSAPAVALDRARMTVAAVGSA